MRQTSSSLYRFAIFVALCALLVLIDGALVTGNAATTPSAPGLAEAVHPWAGAVVSVLAVVLIVWTALPRKLDPSPFGWIPLVLVLAGSGNWSRFPSVGTLHAVMAQLFFASAVAIVVVTSPAWQRGPDLVEDYGWPSLRSFSVTTPVLVLFQVYLGAALRHKAMGALSHLGFAMLAALWILIECVFLIQQFPQHRILRPAANWLLAITCVQVFLGIGAFTMRTMEMDGTPALAAATAAHVAIGALTLAISVVVSLCIRSNVVPKGSLSAPAEPNSQA